MIKKIPPRGLGLRMEIHAGHLWDQMEAWGWEDTGVVIICERAQRVQRAQSESGNQQKWGSGHFWWIVEGLSLERIQEV